MKKPYISPRLKADPAELGNLLNGSVRSTNGISYGGVDENGELTPSARQFDSWDDDEN